MIQILFLGDVVGRPGRQIVRAQLPELKSEFEVDLVIANGENAAGGLGVDRKCCEELFAAGVDLLTLGNHTWKKKEIQGVLAAETKRILRPANYPAATPGVGGLRWQSKDGWTLALFNVMGRIFIPEILDCPFQRIDALLAAQELQADIRFVDFHAEATSEKMAMGYYLDRRVHCVVGTHTHVQTADERLLPGGTAYITDVGMCGPADGVIGVDATTIVERFCSGLPTRFELAKGANQLNAIVLSLDPGDFSARSIQRIFRRDD